MEASFAGMVQGLYHFAGFVPRSVVRSLIDSGRHTFLGMHWKDLTVMFTDVKGFTTVSETTPPNLLVQALQVRMARAQGTAEWRP